MFLLNTLCDLICDVNSSVFEAALRVKPMYMIKS